VLIRHVHWARRRDFTSPVLRPASKHREGELTACRKVLKSDASGGKVWMTSMVFRSD
jgi:hypothetical protein